MRRNSSGRFESLRSSKGIQDVSKRLYQSPGKENKPCVIIASKPQIKTGQKPVIIKETKIIAKLKNKENKFQDKMINERTSASRRHSYSMKNSNILQIKNFNRINNKNDSKQTDSSNKIFSTNDTSKMATNKLGSAFRSNQFTTDDGRVIHTIELDEEVDEMINTYKARSRIIY